MGDYDEVWAMCPAHGGKLLLAGYAVNGTEDFALALIDKKGKIDSTFCTHGRAHNDIQGFDDRAWAISLAPGGKAVAAGYSRIGNYPNNYPEATVVRYAAGLPTALPVTPGVIEGIQLYPNPTTGEVHISGTLRESMTSVTVTDIMGRIIAHYLGAQSKIQLPHLTAGLYLCTLIFRDHAPVVRRIEVQQ